MNSLMEEKWSWIEGTQAQRIVLLDSLTDDDLSFNPGGTNMTLGMLLRESGEVQHSYIESLKSFKQDFAYRNPEPGLAGSTSKLKAWYQAMDDEMKTIISTYSDEDVKKNIEREGGYSTPVGTQLDIYLQALLIFFGKVSIFLRAMNKPLPQGMDSWIG
jgi:hypothetical protein